jgi:hypothetical protein
VPSYQDNWSVLGSDPRRSPRLGAPPIPSAAPSPNRRSSPSSTSRNNAAALVCTTPNSHRSKPCEQRPKRTIFPKAVRNAMKLIELDMTAPRIARHETSPACPSWLGGNFCRPPGVESDGAGATQARVSFVAFMGAGASSIPPSLLPSWTQFNDLLLQCFCERLSEYSRQRQPTAEILATFRARRDSGQFFAPDFQAQLMEEEIGADYFNVWQSIDTDVYSPVHASLAELAAGGTCTPSSPQISTALLRVRLRRTPKMHSGELEHKPLILDLLGNAHELGTAGGNPWVKQATDQLEQKLSAES